MEQSRLKHITNLQALRELFNCGIYRSEGESFIYLSLCLSVSSPMFILRVIYSRSDF